MKHLVVTADDFGLSEEINAAVEAAHRDGILSAASLMVGGPAADDAVARARRLPRLRVGLHLVLADGEPVMPAAQIAGLLDRDGQLRGDLVRFGARIMFDRALRRQMNDEVAAQFERFRGSGLPLDHVNAHRHFQLHPALAAAIFEIGPRYGMRALRVPIEPWSVIAAIDPKAPRGLGVLTAPWASWLRARARRAGLTIADAVFGLAWTGAMTADRIAAVLARLPEGLSEIYLHPAVNNAFAGAARDYRYAEEFAALRSADCIAAVKNSGCMPGGYADARDS